MNYRIALFFLLYVLIGSNAVANPPAAAELAKLQAELVQMRHDDQAVRKALGSIHEHDKIEAMWAVDAKNLKRLKEIIQIMGWPTKRLVGEEASTGAFLIAQHAASDIPFMTQALVYIEAEYKANQVPGSQYALIYDRVQTMNGKPQKYGTQFSKTSEGCMPQPLIHPAKVDEFRAQVGLDKLSDYAARVCQ